MKAQQVGRDWPFWLACAILVLSVAAGGSVQAPPLVSLADQWLGIVAVVATLLTRPRAMRTGLALFGWILAGLIMLLPLLQLIPLPPAVWQALPGRDLATGSAMLFGFADAAMPLSLDPDSTMQSLLAALPALGLFAVVHRISAPGLVRLLLLLIALAIASFLLGLIQVTSGNATLYDTAHEGLPIGFFANRNHQADLLLIGAMVAAVFGARPQLLPAFTVARPAFFAAAAALVVGIIATGSRSGMALTLYGVAAVVVLSGKAALSPRRLALIAIGVVLIPLALVLAGSQVASDSLHRFDRKQTDQRFEFWPAARWTAEHYFPAGSGIGSFDPVFRANEPLSIVGEHYVVHAHNDYIEIPLEGGAPGAALILAFLTWWALATARVWRAADRDLDKVLGRIGAAIVPVFLLHSAFDYPLRIVGTMTVFAFACALLCRAMLRRPPPSALARPETAPDGVTIRPIRGQSPAKMGRRRRRKRL